MTRRSAGRVGLLAALLVTAAYGGPGPTDLGGISQDGMRLGSAMAWAGDFVGDGGGYLVVGAEDFDEMEEDQGGVFLFQATAQGFVYKQKLGVGTGVQAHLGASLAAGCDINGDGAPDVVAGAPGDATRAGSVQVFFGGENAPATTTLTGATPAGALFGAAVACADVNGDELDDVVVGAPDATRNFFGVKSGSVFVYFGTGSGVANAFIELPGGTADERFGAAIASPGDVDGDGRADLVVGAPAFRVSGFAPGRVSLVRLPMGAGGLTIAAAFDDPMLAGPTPAELGASVAALGDVNGDGVPDVAVGAPGAEATGIDGTGAIVVLAVGGNGFSRVRSLSVVPGVARLGRSLAAAGDVNGDGFADLLAGHEGYSDPGTHQATPVGIAFLGDSEGMRAAPRFLQAPAGSGAEYGWTAAGLGDLNKDGFADVAVSDPRALVASTPTGPTLEAGTIYAITGGSRGPGGTFISRPAGQPGALGGVGDVNGDGLDDYAIGYPAADGNSGTVVVVLGARSSLGNLNAMPLTAPVANARFGASVAGAGDVNGDGYGDFIVGAPQLNNSAMGVGSAFVFYGSQGRVDASKAVPLTGSDANGFFGTSVASAGDFNGDGYDDVAVGAPGAPGGGAVLVYFGASDGLRVDRVLPIPSPRTGAFFGASVASAGDTDLDGFADLVVGAPGFSGAVLGRIFIVRGAPTGFADVTELGGTTAEMHGLGRSVSGARDLNGDGRPDVIATATPPDRPGTVRAFAFLIGPTPTDTQAVMLSLLSLSDTPVQSVAVSGLGDVDGDGLGDVLLGSADLGLGGEVRLFYGDRNGALRASGWQTASSGNERLGIALAGVGDLNDDGFADFATASVNNGVRLFAGGDLLPGRPYVLEQRFSGAPKGRGYHALQGEPVVFSALLRDEVAALGPLQLEVEVKPVRLPFDGTNTLTSPPVRTGEARVDFMMPAADRYHWRARVLSAGVAGRWRVYGANDETGTDFSWGLAVVTQPDAGVDAGEPGADGGVDAGSVGGGVDGGVDGGTGPLVFDAVGCNCAAFPAAPTAALLLALLVQRARRRRR